MKCDIDNLPAGPETDRLIFKEVFGLECDEIPKFSTDRDAALDVADLLSSSEDWDEHPFEIHRNYANQKMWTASFNDYQYQASAETFALAICRAALKSVLFLEKE